MGHLKAPHLLFGCAPAPNFVSKLSLRHRSIPSTQNSPRLPPEIIWVILECLTEHFSPYEVDFNSCRSSKHAAQLVGRAKAYFNDLYNRTLVCHSWYPMTNQFLYSYPILISSRQLRLFRRSLERNPILTLLVRDIRFTDNSRFYQWGMRWVGSRARHEKHAERMRENARYILRACRSLDAITMHVSPFPFLNSIANILQKSLALSKEHHIRRLTVSGTGHYRIDIDASFFDNLERLTLQSSEFRPRGGYDVGAQKSLPELQSLQLVRAYSFFSRSDVMKSLKGSPKLCHLDFIDTFFFLLSDDHIHCPTTLERLTLIGSAELDMLNVWSQCEFQTLTSLRQLTIGVLGHDDDTLAGSWTIPPNLETLSVLICECAWKTEDIEKKYLVRFVKKNARMKKMDTFRLLEVFVVGNRGDDGGDVKDRCQENDSHSASLRETCAKYSIPLKINYINVIDDWVRDHIS
ncbi:hypothetical protein QCA50_014387 [Cerrena zonata]|uniref:F-box domain-containing protein n=1 Tax=Cerrena zonata TaxID=2478898 RepID=A0AAW0FZ60_9APHY